MPPPISYERKLNEGRGEGAGKNYKPWYEVGEKVVFPGIKNQKGRGNGNRVPGLKTKRVHHLLSDHEKLLFMTFDLNPDVADIREQFPLKDIDLARKIAVELGIKYPSHVENHILTSDFFLDFKNGHKEVITFKPLANITPRQLELFQIERSYWENQGVPWKLMTEKGIPNNQTYLKNFLDVYRSVSAFHDGDFQIDQIKDFYFYLESKCHLKNVLGIVDFCKQADKDLGYQEDVCLRMLKILRGKRLIEMDLNLNVFSNELSLDVIKVTNVNLIDKSTLAA